jgi:hypothetical protein
LNGVDTLDVKLEELMADFDGVMSRIFRYFGFSEGQCETALEVARSEDIRRMDDAAIAKRPQITSREISKWRDFIPSARVAQFEAAYGDLIVDLGYELSVTAFTVNTIGAARKSRPGR